MLFSILVPSLRPELYAELVKQIAKTTPEEYELLTDNTPGGVYQAVNRLFEQAKGEYIVHICDDCSPQAGWLTEMLELMRKHDNEIFVGGFSTFHSHTILYPCSYYKKPFAGLICIRKDVAQKFGGLIDPRYKQFYGDPDLSLRAWEAGGTVEHTPNHLVAFNTVNDELKGNNIATYYAADEAEFKRRWDGVFPQ